MDVGIHALSVPMAGGSPGAECNVDIAPRGRNVAGTSFSAIGDPKGFRDGMDHGAQRARGRVHPRQSMCKGNAMNATVKLVFAGTTAALVFFTGAAVSAQDKYALKSPSGIPFSDFKG
jgi:hypothetical protein